MAILRPLTSSEVTRVTQMSGSSPLTLTFSGSAGAAGVAYAAALVGLGGVPPYMFAIASGSLPPGLTLNAATGAITGTPTTIGLFSFVGQVTDTALTVVTLSCSISITVEAPNITSATCAIGYQSWGNAIVPVFSGVITLPTAALNYSSLAFIVINAVSPSGVAIPLTVCNAPSGGFTGSYLNYSGWSNQILQTSVAQTGWAVQFVCETPNYIATPNPVTDTGLTILGAGNLPKIDSVTITEIGPRFQNPPGGNTYDTVKMELVYDTSQVTIPTFTYWRSFNNGASGSWQWGGWLQGEYGVDSYGVDNFFIPLGNNTYVVAVAPGTYNSSITSPLAYAVTSNALSISIGAASNTAAYLGIFNTAGAPPTEANIYMGPNALNNPYAQVVLTVQTAGATDTATYFYDVWCAWTDGSGNMVNPGGVMNTSGWQHFAGGPANNGQLWSQNLEINYPAGDYYLTFEIWARTRNATAGTPPFSSDPSGASVLCLWPSSLTYYRLHVGPAPNSLFQLELTNNLLFLTQAASGIALQGVAGLAPYSYVITVGTLPTGLSLNSSTGVISGTPTIAGKTTLTAVATDTTGNTATLTFYLLVTSGPLLITFAGTNGQVGQAYSSTVHCVGGIPAYTFAITASGGTLGSAAFTAAGFVLNASTGVITAALGAITAVGATLFTVQVTDSVGEQNSQNFIIIVVSGALALSATAPIASLSQPYTGQLTATGGVQPYTYAISSGTVPPGLSISSSSGLISGTPTATGKTLLQGEVTDAAGNIVYVNFTIIVTSTALRVIYIGLPGTLSAAFSASLVASGGVPGASGYVYSETGLPSWATLNTATGVITGTPNAVAATTFTGTVTDSIGNTANVTATIVITGALALTITGNVGVLGQTFAITVQASGGMPAYTYSISSGSLPSWATLNTANGIISGTANAVAVTSFTVKATDVNGNTGTLATSITVAAANIVITFSSAASFVNSIYNGFLGATGGVAPYTYAITVGAKPSWATFVSATGLIYGTPSASGTTNFTVTCTDSVGNTQTLACSIVINATTLQVSFSGGLGIVGRLFGATLVATGGQLPYTFSAASPFPPTWSGTGAVACTINASSGLITGTPGSSNAGSTTFTGKVTDNQGNTATVSCTILITSGPILITFSPSSGVLGQAYLGQVGVAGGVTAYTYAITGTNTLTPIGLALSTTTGAITGTPNAAGAVTFTVQITDSVGATNSQAFTLTITGGGLAISFAGPVGTPGVAYQGQATATGGVQPYVYSFSVAPSPTWSGTGAVALTINSATGAITGTPGPANTGNTTFTVLVTDHAGNTANTGTVTVIISALQYLPPQVTATASIAAYQAYGNGIMPIFGGTITIPTGSANIGQLASIGIYAVNSTTGQSFLLLTVPEPGGGWGSSFSYNASSHSVLQTTSTQNFTVQFISFNSAGVASFPYTSGTVTVAAANNSLGVTTVTISDGTHYQNPPGGSTYTTITASIVCGAAQSTVPTFTIWQQFGSSGWTWVGWYQGSIPGTSGSPSVVSFTVLIPVGTASYEITVSPGAYTGNTPTGGNTTSNSLSTVVIGAASAGSGSIMSITNAAGSAPTTANIFMGPDAAGNPSWKIAITCATQGASDPNTYFYDVWICWTNSSGTLITVGGVALNGGWQNNTQFGNNGATQTGTMQFEYPATSAYLCIQVWARTRNNLGAANITAAIGSLFSDGSVPVKWPGGLTYYLLDVGTAPGGVVQGPSQTTNLQASVLTDPSFVYSTPGLVYENGQGQPAGPGYLNPAWLVGTPPTGQLLIESSGGHSSAHWAELLAGATAGSIFLEQYFAVQPGLPCYVQLYVQSSNNTVNHSLSIYIYWYNAAGSMISYSTVASAANYVSSWTLLSGIATAPALAAEALFVIQTNGSEPSGAWWGVDDIYVQQVVNQTNSGQVQTLAATSVPAGLEVFSATTAALAYYGQSEAYIIASDGLSSLYLNTTPGVADFVADNGTQFATLGFVGSSDVALALDYNASNSFQIEETSSGLSISMINGGSSFSGYTGTVTISGTTLTFKAGICTSV